MFTKDTYNIARSSLLSSVDGLMHGFSNRKHGDMRVSDNRLSFYTSLGCPSYEEYFRIQIHSTLTNIIRDETNISTFKDADAVMYVPSGKKKRQVILTIRYADCVPIILVDPETGILAAVHSGWQGTLHAIIEKTIALMKQNGAEEKNILSAIGSHICSSCYTVPEERARRFLAKFNEDEKVAWKINDIWHVDLGYVNKQLLLNNHIEEKHIDCATYCTSCTHPDGFSYRKDTSKSYGVMMGVVAWKN